MKAETIAVLIALALCGLPATAADHGNLEEGLPAQVEDAYPTAYRNREIQFVTRYQHNDDGTDEVLFRPVFEYGIWRNTQIAVESDFLTGNADRTGCGDVSVHALYNFNTESLAWPAFAIDAGITAPSGRDSEGVDSSAKLILTKTLFGLHKMHFNFVWHNNDEPEDDERSDRYAAIFGYSMPLNADTILVADYVREEQREEDMDSNIVELGVRYKFNPRTVLATGLGFGIGEESPDVRAMFGLQYSF